MARNPPPTLALLAVALCVVLQVWVLDAAGAASGSRWPTVGIVVRGFDPPATDYGAGHRGVDIAANGGDSVVAASSGTVTYAGTVAGRGVVTITTPDGVLITVEPVRAIVTRGALVSVGDVLGTVTAGIHCPQTCVHVSVRRAATSGTSSESNSVHYLDPFALLGDLPQPAVLWSRIDAWQVF